MNGPPERAKLELLMQTALDIEGDLPTVAFDLDGDGQTEFLSKDGTLRSPNPKHFPTVSFDIGNALSSSSTDKPLLPVRIIHIRRERLLAHPFMSPPRPRSGFVSHRHAAAQLLARYQALVLARKKLNEDGPLGSPRSTDAAKTRIHTEILRIRSPALPELDLYHGLSIDTYGVEIDRPERVVDGGIFTSVNGREHFLLPHFTGQNPDSSTAVHDDFMMCPFGTRLIEMESCPRLASRFRSALAQSKDPVHTLREILALGLVLDLHLSRLGGFHTPRPIRRLEELEPSGQIRLSADVLSRLPKLPRKPPYILPQPLAEKNDDSYLATAYVSIGSQAWFVELRGSPQSLYFARSLVGAVPTYGP